MTTITTVYIKNQDGNNPLTGAAGQFQFDPCPDGISYRASNTPGKTPMDLPGYYRPTMYYSRSQQRVLTIKTVLLGTRFTAQSILNWLNDLFYIMYMGGSTNTYLQVMIPFGENFSGSVYTYSQSDADKDNAMMVNGSNYLVCYVHPDDISIDKLTRNAAYVTLTFSEVEDVITIG